MSNQTPRTIAVKILAWCFKTVPVPESFRAFFLRDRDIIVVTQSGSAIIEALLLSFALQTGYAGLTRGKKETVKGQPLLRWGSINDTNFLRTLSLDELNPFLSTLTVFSLRGPVRNNPTYHMSILDLLLLLILTRSSVMVFGTPFQLLEPERQGRRSPLRRIRVDFYKNLKLVRGIPFETQERQARSVLESAECRRDLQLIADKTHLPLSEVTREAYREFTKVAANPLRPMYGIIATIARLVVRRLFSQINVYGLDRLMPVVRDSTVVLVPMHRSHLDYIVLGSALYDSHLNTPLVAAGMNLNFWPSGFLMRSVGAYFVRREARQDRIHATVLKHYVGYLVSRGHLQEFFIEGGRSRSGKMLPPKVGLLGIMIETFKKRPGKDLYFVPASVTYEHVVEGSVFGEENTGRPKRRENFFELLRAGKIFKKKYGDVLVNFGTPISLAQSLEEFHSKNPHGDQRQFVQKFGFSLVRAIREQSNPSLMSYTHTALMSRSRYTLTYPRLSEAVKNLARLAEIQRNTRASFGRDTPLLTSFLSGNESDLTESLPAGAIERAWIGRESVFFIPGERRFTADFYRNLTAHLFFIPSTLAAIELRGEKISVEKLKPIYELFEIDWLLPPWEEFAQESAELIERLSNAGILSTEKSFEKRDVGLFLPGMLLGSFQSLSYVLNKLESAPLEPDKVVGDPLSYAETLKQLMIEARAAQYLGVLSRTEATSRTALTTAIETLHRLGALKIRGDQKTGTIQLTLPLHPIIEYIRETDRAISTWMHLESGSR